MDFARKQMEKYGWKEGQGLGKHESGITNALKPELKNNNNGLGFDIAEEFTNNWWDKLYKKASDNIAVTHTSDEVKLAQIEPDSVEISSSDSKFIKKGKKGIEQSFIKTSKMLQGNTINYNVLPERYELKIPALSDEELFKACSGRTAHKGARHGLNLSGKLSRIEKQEKILLKQMRRISLNEDKVEKKCKKLDKLKSSDKLDKKDDEKLSKKKKKKKRKAVSFSEAICEVIPEVEADSSFNSEDRLGYESSSTGDLPHPPSPRSPSPVPDIAQPIIDPNVALCTGLPDEGIEQDFQPDESNNLPLDELNGNLRGVNDHRSFEEPNYSKAHGLFADLKDSLLSKAEKKLKMRKMRATQKFIVDTALLTDDSDNRSDKELSIMTEIEANLKRKKYKLDEGDGRPCKSCKKSKKEKRDEKVVNRIAKGLEKVCKISDNDEKKKKGAAK